ncbi:alpha/beta fold hydrolase [Halogeometricum luteum]|uniref:Alpha/beta hydrolase n=1 Tax=Halogeometricum luteum TaxID=2950537 RepID=A0ABU2FWR7_9EURY|nr:alpha/beta hydrolase [Halogeometricum sp. S3BR5-2]MDS0292972.1 alpha/beta hydrolase [Halogeometricum sp. S3BR5-2]
MPTIRANGVDTYYERRGNGPTVVFVHASMLDHSVWDEQVEALSDGYSTVTYDLRGHGRTGPSAEPEYAVDLYVADLRALLSELGVRKPVLCGLSMGGTVALTYAATYPDDLSGLVLVDAFAPEFRSRGEWFLRRVALSALVPPVRLLGLERVERANVWLTARLFPGADGDYGNVERLREAGPRMATEEFAKVVRSMARPRDPPVDLSAVSAPTLVLYGERDLPFVRLHAARFAARIPTVEVDEVPDAGHAANLDAPEYVTAAVRAFLDGLGLGADAGESTGTERRAGTNGRLSDDAGGETGPETR